MDLLIDYMEALSFVTFHRKFLKPFSNLTYATLEGTQQMV